MNSGAKKMNETELITPPGQVLTANASKSITTAASKNTLETSAESSGLVKSASMNLIDDTAEHLFDLMIALEKDSNVHALHENVRAAVGCADQIHKLLRLKLDVIKMATKGNK